MDPAKGEKPLGLWVLVVEKNGEGRRDVLRLLEGLGCQAVAVGDGRAAVKTAALDRFDLVLMDVGPPTLGGLEGATEIRRGEAGCGRRHLPILAMTDHSLGEEPDRCLQAGVDGFLIRPITHEVLRAALESWAPPLPSLAEDERPLRFAILQERCLGDVRFALEVLRSFRDTAPGTMRSIAMLIDQGDLERLAVEAHGLQGSASTVGASPLATSLGRVEAASRSGDLDGSRVAVGRALADWADLLPALAAAEGEVAP